MAQSYNNGNSPAGLTAFIMKASGGLVPDQAAAEKVMYVVAAIAFVVSLVMVVTMVNEPAPEPLRGLNGEPYATVGVTE